MSCWVPSWGAMDGRHAEWTSLVKITSSANSSREKSFLIWTEVGIGSSSPSCEGCATILNVNK